VKVFRSGAWRVGVRGGGGRVFSILLEVEWEVCDIGAV
jgi:hypothetical protein